MGKLVFLFFQGLALDGGLYVVLGRCNKMNANLAMELRDNDVWDSAIGEI